MKDNKDNQMCIYTHLNLYNKNGYECKLLQTYDILITPMHIHIRKNKANQKYKQRTNHKTKKMRNHRAKYRNNTTNKNTRNKSKEVARSTQMDLYAQKNIQVYPCPLQQRVHFSLLDVRWHQRIPPTKAQP